MHLARTRDGRYHTAMRWAGLLGLLVIVASLFSGIPVAATAAPGDPVLYEQTDARFSFAGSWLTYSAAPLSGGSHGFTNTAGASVTLTFVGTRLDLVAMTGPKFGNAQVSVDGGAPTNVDFYSADTLVQQTVYTTGDLASGLHTVKIACAGTKSAPATDTYVSVDAVWVSGTLTGAAAEQSDYRIAKRGSWVTYSTAGLSGGSHMFSNVTGNEYAIAFTGTRLDLVAMTGPKFGIGSVSIDGGAPVDVDFYSAATTTRQMVYSTGDLAAGVHVVRVKCTGRKNPAATDTFIGLDAALVTGAIRQATMRYEETDPRLGWAGQMSEALSPAFSAGRYIWAGPSWGAMSVSFVGTGMDWIGVVGPQYGIAEVTVDGGAPGYVDLYSPAVQTNREVYTTGELPWGLHTVTIGWTGRKNDAASGTYISYDAFDVGGDIVQAPTPVQPVFAEFNYPWNRYLVVDKSDLRIYYVVDGALIASYPVAVGKASTPTPSGIWRIGAKYYSSGVFGPRKMRMFRQSGNTFVYTAYNIHGTNVDSSIGTYASHGCIRLHNYDILVLFDMVPLGTMVVTRN
ncbi:MAG: L,D-transpeptidase [Coriobacteriia bacterium]|nr:L,D-transpeptidase [Coriobacteriia bacterium]